MTSPVAVVTGAAGQDGSYLVDGRTDLVELGDRLGEAFESSRGFHTAAGLIIENLDFKI